MLGASALDRLKPCASANIDFYVREHEMSRRVTNPEAPHHRGAPKTAGLRRHSLPLDLADELRESILRGEFGDGAVLRQEAWPSGMA